MFVFPAFNSSYNTRKRTFRCCKKCRAKRIRCKLSDQYEKLGCDNCKARNIECDLVADLRAGAKDGFVKTEPTGIPPAVYVENSVPTNTQNCLKKESFLRPDSHFPLARHDSRSNDNFRNDAFPHGMVCGSPYSSSQSELRKAPPPPMESGFDPRRRVSSGHYESSPPALANNMSSLPERSHSFPNTQSSPLPERSGHPASNGFLGPSPTSVATTAPSEYKNPTVHRYQHFHHRGERRQAEKDPSPKTQSEFSGSANQSPIATIHIDQTYIDSLESIIHQIDYRYLKTHFDFNINFRQSRFYFHKINSRKQLGNVKTSTEDRMSVTHLKKLKCLDATDLPLFKFLLSINAFTLDTPGFYTITEADLVKLLEIYFFKTNSVFPIVFEAEFWELYKRNRIPNIILYAVVLNAARDELSEPILARSFAKNGASFQVNYARFLKELDLKIRQLLVFLPELGDTEKLARLITHLLLSLCFKLNQFGNEQSSSDIGDCVSYAYSLVIHHQFFHKRLEEAGASLKSAYLKHLWWTIFIFDRFNGLLNGKAMYINHLDFNIERPADLPHLNRLVELACTLEGTLIAVFRPSAKDKSPNTICPEFSPARVIENELVVISNIDGIREKLGEYKKCKTGTVSHLPDIPMHSYRDRMVFFLERLVHYQALLLLRTGQAKYSGEDPHFDEFSLHIGKQLFETLSLLKDGQQYKLVLSTPLIPSIILVAFSVSMTARLKVMRGDADIVGIAQHKITEAIGSAKNFLGEIKQMSKKWWFVQEVMVSLERLNLDTTGTPPSTRKSPAGSESSASKRSKLSINSLVSDVADPESVLPTSHSITSPGIYEDVIDKDESDTEDGDYDKDQPISSKALVPPVLFSNVWDTPLVTFEDSAVKKSEQPIKNPMSSRDSITSGEDVHFDVAGLVDVVNNEANFMPNVMEFLSDANFDFWK